MRVHRLDYQDNDLGTIVEWFDVGREAKARKAELEEAGTFVFSLRDVELPRSRAGMVNWLNAYLDRDNG